MGGEAEVTVMVLKVDLGCVKCCRKVKRVLCSIPQVRNQIFDDKTNTVTVSVLCCTPERVIRKISEKAGRTVKGIDILQPSASAQPPPNPKPVLPKEAAGPPPPPSVDKPKPQSAPPPQVVDKPKSAPPPAEKPKSDDKPKTAAAPPPAEKPKSDDKPKPATVPPPTDKPKPDEKPKSALPPMDKPKSDDKPKPAAAAAAAPPPTDDKPKKRENSPPPPQQQQQQQQIPPVMMKPNQPAAFMSPELFPVAGYPSIFPPPHVVYYDQGGPYNTYQNQIQQPLLYPPYGQPIYQYDGYQGRPVVGDGYYGGGKQHFAEDNNPSACSVM